MKTLFIWFYFLVSFELLAQSTSTFSTSCAKPGFSCGECESSLQDDLNSLITGLTPSPKTTTPQHWSEMVFGDNPEKIPMRPEANVESTLTNIINLFKKHNPAGQNKLNFIVIGQSESLQATSIKDKKIYPRIMLKSPNSELIVTFNTDPMAAGFNAIEIQRWNGRQGKYEYQELNFGERKSPSHIDTTGKKCMECHKSPSSRPNWDTYRAWAGIVPARDDMLEMHAKEGEFIKSGGLQPDARAYLGFLRRVASDKDKGVRSRLALLDIPFDTDVQLTDYKAKESKMSNAEKVAAIEAQVKKEGFYRIKHFPDKTVSQAGLQVNFDQKTAEYAGPSQFAFDQMLSQNMCRVATDLKRNPQFDRFKEALAWVFQCNGQVSQIVPPNYLESVLSHYNRNRAAIFRDKPTRKNFKTFEEVEEAVTADTEANHKRANKFKFERHEQFLRNYMTQVEGVSGTVASEKARFYSRDVVSPTQPGFHAIEDAGGVSGVEEGSTAMITQARLLLEPLKVDVGHWSLAHGRDSAYNSYSFSDQFGLLPAQEVFSDLLNEAGGCANLEQKAKEKLALPPADAPPPGGISPEELAACKVIEMVVLEEVQKSLEVSIAAPSMQKCLACHDQDGERPFPGLRDFVTNPPKETTSRNGNVFLKYLAEFLPKSTVRNIDVFLDKLGPDPQDGSPMPPNDWSDNADFAKKHDFPMRDIQNTRRSLLAKSLRALVPPLVPELEWTVQPCGNLNDSMMGKTPAGPGPILPTTNPQAKKE